VPALILDDGQLLTEGAIIVQYIADQKPASRLAPPVGTPERLRLQEWLNFIATELHKSFGPLNNPKANDELKESLKERLALRFQFLAKSLRGKAFISGDGFTVADGYAYYTLRNWRKVAGANFADSPVLAEYFDRIGARPAVKAALATEGLT
jgi:glutathione S-transferase